VERLMRDVAILWDFDGTLVDSAALWRRSEYAFLAARKLAWNDEASRRLVGGNLDFAAQVMSEVTGTTFAVEDLRAEMHQHVMDALEGAVPWMPGAERLLSEQRAAGIRSALVTSSYPDMIAIALKHLSFEPFDIIVSRDDVVLPKPHAEPYLTALGRLGIGGADALALEDSVSGVTSALGAGCHVAIVTDEALDIEGETGRLHRLGSLADVSLTDLIALLAV
jgi:HAD superfamily hydrolase (TIGR01509 family)